MTLKEYRPNGVTWGRNGSLSRTEKQGWRPLPGRAGLAPRSIFAANYARILTATDKRFFLSLINATEPATETALPRPATAERNARGEKTRKRFIEIAATLKAEADITQHTAHKKMTGRASLATGAILAPAGTTRRQLYVLAHECGHIALHSALKSRRKPRHVEEHEAESYAHRALAAHGLEVPEVSTYGARCYVGECIEEDRAKGIPICPLAEAFAMGRRSPYASLPSVDAFRRRKESPPGVASKIPMTGDNEARFFKRT